MEQIKAAVIGTGIFGALHARYYFESPLTELVAVVNRTESKGRAVAEQYNAKWYPTVEALLENEDFEIASVCTSEEMHVEQGRTLAEAGKKILMEKPLARTIEEVDEMIRYVDENNTYMAVDYILHNDPRFSEIKKKCDNNEFGDHISYYARRRGTFTGALYYGPWTDILISTGIHDIDLMCWFNGTKPVRVFAEAVINKCKDIPTYDAVIGTIMFENGTVGCIETSWVMADTEPWGLDTSFHLMGSEAAAIVEGEHNGYTLIEQERYSHPDITHWPILQDRLAGDLKASLDTFVMDIINNKEPFQTLRMAKTSHEIVFAMRKSIETHMPVNL